MRFRLKKVIIPGVIHVMSCCWQENAKQIKVSSFAHILNSSIV